MNKILFAMISLGLICSCSTETTYELKLCNGLENEVCLEQDSVFEYEKTVYIQLQASQPYEQDSIKGNIFGLVHGEKDGRFRFATKVFAIEEGQTTIEHYIPFGQFGSIGRHEIEFTDMDDRVLASAILRIRRPDQDPNP